MIDPTTTIIIVATGRSVTKSPQKLEIAVLIVDNDEAAKTAPQSRKSANAAAAQKIYFCGTLVMVKVLRKTL